MCKSKIKIPVQALIDIATDVLKPDYPINYTDFTVLPIEMSAIFTGPMSKERLDMLDIVHVAYHKDGKRRCAILNILNENQS